MTYRSFHCYSSDEEIACGRVDLSFQVGTDVDAVAGSSVVDGEYSIVDSSVVEHLALDSAVVGGSMVVHLALDSAVVGGTMVEHLAYYSSVAQHWALDSAVLDYSSLDHQAVDHQAVA